ncbi:MAG: GNAT family N-acetyltransferase [Actinomycetota bacterium]|nr:GNAT family N-acetyltransferase [Actinomycetota bacterium]
MQADAVTPPGGPGAAAVQTDRYDSIASIADEWEALADRVGAKPWLRPGWFDAWHSAFGRGRLEVFAVRSGDRLAAVAPFERYRSARVSLTNWHTPFYDAVAESEQAATALVRAALEDRPARLDAAFVSAAARGHAILAREGERNRCRLVARTIERPPYLELEPGWHVDRAGLPGKLRADLRRRRRQLEAEGEVAVEVLDGRTELGKLLDEGFAVEASGWKGEEGTAINSRRDTRLFYERIAEWTAPRSWLRLSFLRLGGRAIAFEYLLEHDAVLARLKGGYDPEFRRFAPSKLLLAGVLEAAAARGVRRFEFLGGEEPWKLEWTNHFHDLRRIQLFPRTAAGTVAWTAWAFGRPAAKRLLALARR